MKTLKSKFLFPIVAIVFAITTSAFTTIEASQVDDNSAIMGYIYQSAEDPCHQVSVPECSVSGNKTCFYSPGVVAKQLLGTSCPVQLKRP